MFLLYTHTFLISELCYDLLVDEKENNDKLSFDTFDLTSIMNCSALIASTDIEQDNQLINKNGKINPFYYVY